MRYGQFSKIDSTLMQKQQEATVVGVGSSDDRRDFPNLFTLGIDSRTADHERARAYFIPSRGNCFYQECFWKRLSRDRVSISSTTSYSLLGQSSPHRTVSARLVDQSFHSSRVRYAVTVCCPASFTSVVCR